MSAAAEPLAGPLSVSEGKENRLERGESLWDGTLFSAEARWGARPDWAC